MKSTWRKYKPSPVWIPPRYPQLPRFCPSEVDLRASWERRSRVILWDSGVGEHGRPGLLPHPGDSPARRTSVPRRRCTWPRDRRDRESGIRPARGVRSPVGIQIEPGINFGETATIIGVVGDVRMRKVELLASYDVLVVPAGSSPIRTWRASSLPQARLVNSVKRAMHSSYREQAVFNIRTMGTKFSPAPSRSPRFQASMTGAFALLALAMAASGMYTGIFST